MSGSMQYVALVLCLAVALASALPQNFTVPENKTEQAFTGRQVRVDTITEIARSVLTPANVAQFKNFIGGFGGFPALSNILTFNPGNLVILTLLAGTALLIAPTVLGLFGLGAAGTFGTGLGRSASSGPNHLDKPGAPPTHMTINMYRAIDGFFKSYNIDAATCMQRFACSAARKTSGAVRQGNPTYLDSTLNYVLNSSYVNQIMGQTKFMEAVEFGRSSGDCEITYGKCPFSWEKVAHFLPFNAFMATASTQATPNSSESNKTK